MVSNHFQTQNMFLSNMHCNQSSCHGEHTLWQEVDVVMGNQGVSTVCFQWERPHQCELLAVVGWLDEKLLHVWVKDRSIHFPCKSSGAFFSLLNNYYVTTMEIQLQHSITTASLLSMCAVIQTISSRKFKAYTEKPLLLTFVLCVCECFMNLRFQSDNNKDDVISNNIYID